ncbi:MAG: STELLO glycosyltransferase family protein [Bacteroidota bacterium]
MTMQALVITSIANDQHPILKQFATDCLQRNIPFYLMGDTKSPADFNLEGCNFYSIDDQIKTGFSIVDQLPVKHYSRKNIGYLLAIQQGAETIIESDDDNIPLENFWNKRERYQTGDKITNQGWINIFNHFSTEHIWPRGYPIELVQAESENIPSIETGNYDCPIQIGLVQKNPDVDAIYRMTCKLPVYFEDGKKVSVGNGTWSPFNSQNTVWYKDAFPLMYLPSYCSFRMTDIWRSFIAQRIAWENDWNICFHSPSVIHERNEAILLNDFNLEVPGYLNNRKIAKSLEALNLKRGQAAIAENLLRCYELFVENKWIEDKEMELVERWNGDLKEFGAI